MLLSVLGVMEANQEVAESDAGLVARENASLENLFDFVGASPNCFDIFSAREQQRFVPDSVGDIRSYWKVIAVRE